MLGNFLELALFLSASRIRMSRCICFLFALSRVVTRERLTRR